MATSRKFHSQLCVSRLSAVVASTVSHVGVWLLEISRLGDIFFLPQGKPPQSLWGKSDLHLQSMVQVGIALRRKWAVVSSLGQQRGPQCTM